MSASQGIPWVTFRIGEQEPPKAARDWGEAYGTKVGDTMAPHVVTKSMQADRMITIAGLTSVDVFCDLGCGDGSLLFYIAKACGCRCIGVDVNADLISQANQNSLEEKLPSDVLFVEDAIENMFASPLLDSVTVIFVYLVPNQLAHLGPQLLKWIQQPPVVGATRRIVSSRYAIHGFAPQFLQDELASEPCSEDSYMKSTGSLFLYARPA